MMSMKKIVAGALATTAMMAAAVPAQAAITVNDGGTTVSYGTPSGTELDFSFGYEETGLENPFTALLDFTNTLGGIYQFSLSTSSPAVTFISADISDGSGVLGSLSFVGSLGPNVFWGLENFALDAGNYVLTITGTNTGANPSSSLAGNVHFAAVPEPATWGMMILGFGLLGGLMRRREQQLRVRYDFA